MPRGDDPFLKFLQAPSRETYLAIHRVVTSAAHYDPYGDDVTKLEELYESGDAKGTLARGREAVSKWLLNPRIHYLMAFAARKIGDQEAFEMEAAIGSVCIKGILSTGSGTEAEPWIVTCTLDEYDVLMHLKKEVERQALVQADGKMLDQIDCVGGGSLWFDVTVPCAALERKLAGGQPA